MEEVEEILDKMNDPRLKIIALFIYLGTKGLFYSEINDNDEAPEACKNRLKVSLKFDEPLYYLDTHRGLGNIYRVE